jgi:murein DD-endopeptidase MepM/ murein hydrolase activator NlpD
VYHPEPTPAANQSPAKDPEPTPTAQVQTATYTVCRGDTLWGIAQKNGVTVAELRRWNRLSGNLIHAGQVLKVGESKVVTHTVESGETLWSIATQYRTSVAALATSNGLSSRGTIFPGERLTIPGQAQSVSRGGLSYRLIWPVSGVVTSGWGYRTRFEKFHYGLDIAAQTGTPIKAVMSGVVEFAGWKSGYGYCVFLDHGNGVKTAYGHASKLYVKKGQTVTQGKTIAAVGSTGFSTGPHVHLEVRINGKLVNPTNYLP